MKGTATKARILGRASVYRRLIILAGQNLLWPGVFILLLAILVGAFVVQGQWRLPAATPPPTPTVLGPVEPNATVPAPPPAERTASPVNEAPAISSTVYGTKVKTCGS